MKKMSQNECKKEMLNILKYIDDICSKNNIHYSLIGGSLIGAIRHGGMIPWDDDIDIGLLYEDYQKLIKILKKDDSNYLLLDDQSCNKYYTTHAKLVSKRTHLIEKDYEEIDELGVFVDIFVYMYVPSNSKSIKKFYNKLTFNNKLISGLRKPNKSENHRFLRNLRYLYSSYIVGKKKLYEKNKKMYKKYCNGKYIVSNFPQYGIDKEIQNADFFDEFQRTNFDGIEVSISKEYDVFLTTSFGDYMKLPPKEKRVSHSLEAYWRSEIYEK